MQAGEKWRKPAQWNPSLSKSKILPQYQISLTAQFCPAGILLGLPPQARLLRLAPLEKIHARKEVHSHEKIQHAAPPPIVISPLICGLLELKSYSVFSTKDRISSARFLSMIPSSVNVILRLPRISSCFPNSFSSSISCFER